MTTFLALAIGVAAGLLAAFVAATGRDTTAQAVRGLVLTVALIPTLWWWADSTDQFPATFGGFVIVQIGFLRRQAAGNARRRQ
ncbi:hypothetical protein AB4225_35495 [Streptomyces sp. 2RAF24]|uniref:hypothetical protein n=1 Tax=Streptomyces sp. 2RAF24 TaxID=3232997 RepID=UPI003F9C72B5